ncbi:MAG: carboxyl-terminal processing protease [Saprospiraceae bacterium]|jgi:carboxyl-terminal processing protease
MKMRGPIFFSLIAVVVAIGMYLPTADNAEKETILMQTMLSGLEQLHFSPVAMDDDFSKKVYNLYIDRIDNGRRWLTQEDINQLSNYKLEIDNQSLNGTYEFFDLSEQLIDAGIKKAEGFYKELLEEPFDFSKDEKIELDGDKKSFAKDNNELKDYWRKSLKYEVMNRLYDKMEAQKDLKEGEELKTQEELEKEARKATVETYDDVFERLSKLRRSDRLSDYLNAITNVYDPHTGYFEPKDKENFDISMSGTLEGIGARLQTDGDYTKVTEIVPGGPAWKQKDLEPSDLITAVAQGDEEAESVSGFRIDDVVKLIRGKKGTKVRLTVKKVDGSIAVISIIRDLVVTDESYAKSVILDFPGKAENVGYIKLPRFYADFNRRGGRSCSEDVAKEVEKLKAQNVSGIILDLRDNGGGSLRDVVKMSGLFIEDGPIVQVKGRDRDPEVLEDHDSSVQYDGKLIVMVNEFSASASEILAAALQDYGRAVIVGSKSTFGKGTVQRFIDLDQAIRGYNDIKPLGNIKLTIQKFYRVNGGSTQLKGVESDIVLPDRYQFIEVGERDQDYPMDWSKIEPVDYAQSVTSLNGLEHWKAASAERVKKDKTFQLILENAKRLKTQREDTDYDLNLEAYTTEMEMLEKEAEKYTDMLKEIEGLEVKNMETDLSIINEEESRQARNEEWIKTIKKDIYINEVLSILKDMDDKKYAKE